MNDDATQTALRHRLTEVRDLMSDVHMTVPDRAIFASARRRRTRRAIAAALTAACATIGLVLALVLPGSQAPAVHVQLAAWSVNTNPDGTVTFTLRNTSQPARLQHVLAEAGVPAMVRWGEVCLAQGRHALVSTQGFVKVKTGIFSRAQQPESFFALLGGQTHNLGLDWSWTITPGKIPHGARFVISAIPPERVPPHDIRAVWEFVKASAPVTCARLMKP